MNLTLPQEDIYYDQLLYPGEPIYNIGAKIKIKGEIDFKILKESHHKLIEQHDAFRSVFVCDLGDVQAMVLPKSETSLGFIDFSAEEDADVKANAFMQNTFKEPFDVCSGKELHRFILVKVDSSIHYLFSMYHHIITDGWGTSLMFQRLVKNYNELVENGKILSEYPYSYGDFVADDEKYIRSDEFLNDKFFWKEKFRTIPDRLFNDGTRKCDSNVSRCKELIVKRPVYNQLSEVANELNVTTFHLILGILYLYFGRRYQNKDFSIGLPVLNRGSFLSKKTVGLFMSVNPLRMQLDFGDTFADLVRQVKQQLRQDYRHQRFPLGKLIQELGIATGGHKLFDVTFSYEKQDYAHHFRGTETTVSPLTHESERVALAIYVREFDALRYVKIDFQYNLDYFTATSIDQLVNHFQQLIGHVNLNPHKKLCDYLYLDEVELELLSNGYNRTQFDYHKELTWLSFFKEQVKERPDSIAVRDSIDTYTYRELDLMSSRVSEYILRDLSINDQSPVAVLMPRSARMIVILIGIFKSRCSYIPLDPGFPQSRLDFIIKHANVKWVIGTSELEGRISSAVNFVTAETALRSGYSGSDVRSVTSLDDAYIIYTSGSTGTPKGVVIGHQSLLNLLLSMKKMSAINPGDLLFSVTTQSFDISILEFLLPLVSGAVLYVADVNTLSDPVEIIQSLEKIQPTLIQATPSFYQMLFHAGWHGDKRLKVLCGGDLLSEALAKQLIETCGELWNMYGPTETTIWSSSKRLTTTGQANNIGRPIHNTRIYILDECRQLLPHGSVGNIYIAGDGLAKKYFNNELLTASKFIGNPFKMDETIYDTGDLGRWNDKGEIEFLGRNDNQVKIRGFLIDLFEIETKLTQAESIRSSVVVARKNASGEATLVAYVITDGASINMGDITDRLRRELPAYMVPYAIIPVESFPLTPNHKIDRRLLALRDLNPIATGSISNEPISELETRLCEYFKEVLELGNSVGTTDNFFVLGGHSLSAVRLIGIIEKKLSFRISLKNIFDHPTVADLSRFLEVAEIQNRNVITPIEDRPHYPITLSQKTIWLASLQNGKSIAYNMFRAFRTKGAVNEDVLERVFNMMIDRYEILRTNFVEIDDTPYQRIASSEDVKFSIERFIVDGSILDVELENYANRPFDLKNQMLLRVALFQTTDGDTILLFVTHHIIIDGWSLEIIINELIDNYVALTSGKAVLEKTLGFQFRDYAVWQQQVEQTNRTANRRFWSEYLKSYPGPPLIAYQKDPSKERLAGAFYRFQWDKSFLEKLNEIALRDKITLHTLLISSFVLLIHKVSHLEDICAGTINSGRSFSDLHDQIGMFVKTLPLRTKISTTTLVNELLQTTQRNLLTVDRYQDIPEDLLGSLRLDAILVLQNPTFNYDSIDFHNGLILKSHPVDPRYNRLPLLIDFSVNEDCLNGSIHFDTTKYRLDTIEVLSLQYKRVLEQIIANEFATVDSIDVALSVEHAKTVEIEFGF